jgi:Chemoreceptor zinc-binding domain
MGVMNWLTQTTDRPEVPTAAMNLRMGRSHLARMPALPASGNIDGLTFANAIRAHQVWKKRLSEVLDGTRHPDFEVEHVRRDDKCSLGLWLRSSASHDHRGRAVYRELFGTHAALHQAAAEVLSLHAQGQIQQARLMLERGLFARNSVCVQGLLAQLFFVPAESAVRPLLLTEAITT